MVSTLLLLRTSAGAAAGGGGGALALTLASASQSLSYSEPLGRYPSGAARTLFVQFTRSLTNGSPVSGTLTVPGRAIAVAAHRFGAGTASTLVSFAVPLQDGDIPSADIASCTTGTWTDDTATWVNNNAATWYTGGAGIPAGVLWPTSAAHLCAASSFGSLVPQASQPSFSGSSAVDAALESAITNNLLTWDGNSFYGAATYERPLVPFHYACRTADVAYLKIACAHASRWRSFYWGDFSPLGEQFQDMRSWLWLYLFRRDTQALGTNNGKGLRFNASNVFDSGPTGVGTWFHANTPRFAVSRIKATAAAIKAGYGDSQNQYDTGTFYEMAYALVAEALVTGSTKLTQTNGRLVLPGYDSDGTTIVRSVYSYMAFEYIDAFLELLSVIPTTSNTTALYALLSTSVAWLVANMSGTSSGGTKAYKYGDVDLWYAAVPLTVASTYTSGSTSISITIASAGGSPPDGWDVSKLFSAGCVVRLGGVSKQITAPFTTDGTGTATVTLASGFASGYSAGATGTFMRDASVGVTYDTVDLNGFVAPVLAWFAAHESNGTYTTEAQALLASAGLTPNDGITGPYYAGGKQVDEVFHIGQTTWAGGI